MHAVICAGGDVGRSSVKLCVMLFITLCLGNHLKDSDNLHIREKESINYFSASFSFSILLYYKSIKTMEKTDK